MAADRSPAPWTRRDFLKGAAAAPLAALASNRPFGRRGRRPAPGDVLRIGCIGVGRQGLGDMQECIYRGLESGARVVAVCDADSHRLEHARWTAERLYAAEGGGAPAAPVAAFADFRELLARPDIDGVIVAPPDHWHGLIGIAAASAGKDVYLEKPLTYSIAEGRVLVDAVRRGKRVLQVGSQQRSSVYFRLAAEAVRNGRIGTLKTIRVALPQDQGTGDRGPMPVPRNLNYDVWLGPAPEAPYSQDRVHPNHGFERPGWLQIEAYCRGMITGWGSHMVDSAQWGHGTDETGPVEIEARGEFPDRGLFDVHTTFKGEAVFEDGVRLIMETGEAGVRFEGDAGWVWADRGQVKASAPEILRASPATDKVRLYVSSNHMKDFLERMRDRKDPAAPVEVGHRSNTICVLAHMSMKLGRRLRWNPKAERFVDDPAADALLDRPGRAPWTR